MAKKTPTLEKQSAQQGADSKPSAVALCPSSLLYNSSRRRGAVGVVDLAPARGKAETRLVERHDCEAVKRFSIKLRPGFLKFSNWPCHHGYASNISEPI